MSRVGKFMHKQIVAIVDKRVNDPTYYKYVKSEPIIIKVVDSHKEDGKKITNEWGKGVEAYNINKNIANFTKQIAESTQARDALFLIRDRQNYLADLHNNLQHTGHEELLLNHITQAHTLQENDEMNHLIGTANYAFEKKLLTRDELLHHFKSGQSFDLIHNDIAKPCIDHHRGILNIQANKILRGETVRHAGQNFNCVIKYLEHWQEHVDHKLLPMEKMDHVIDNQMSINRQMNRSHSMSI
jgi:hypothetical protein